MRALPLAPLLLLLACAGSKPQGPKGPPPEYEDPPPPVVAGASTPAPQPTAPATEDPLPPPPPPRPSPAETFKLLLDAINAHDLTKLAQAYADTATLKTNGGPDATSRDAILAAEKPFFVGFPNLRLTPSRTWQKANAMIVDALFSGANTGAFMGQNGAGRNVGVPTLHVFLFDDNGLVKEHHVYMDTTTLLKQLDPQARAGTFRAMSAPAASVEAHVAKGTADEDKLVDVAKSFLAGFNAGKEDDALKSFTDDADFTVNFAPATSRGKAGVKREVHAFFSAFPTQQWDVANAWGVEDFVIVEQTLNGKQMGAYGPLTPSRKGITWHWADVYQVKDGKLTHAWAYANTDEPIAQAMKK